MGKLSSLAILGALMVASVVVAAWSWFARVTP